MRKPFVRAATLLLLSISPCAVSGVLSAGLTHACVASMPDKLVCWGANDFGQLGRGSYGDAVYSSDRVAIDTTLFESIAAGQKGSCAIVDGDVACWGDGSLVPIGHYASFNTGPVSIPSIGQGGAVSHISAGNGGCAVVDHGLKCWGDNSKGQVGDGTTQERFSPTAVTGLAPGGPAVVTSSAVSMQFGADAETSGHTCAVVDGAVRCWSANSAGQLGDGTTAARLTPSQVANLGGTATAVAAGTRHTCAIVSGGVKCWGDNGFGQLGNNSAQDLDSSTPVAVSGLSSGVTAITAGQFHSCALANQQVRCWGNNQFGQLGDGTNLLRRVPVVASAFPDPASEVDAGGNFTCATTFGIAPGPGNTSCWGTLGSPETVWISGFETSNPYW